MCLNLGYFILLFLRELPEDALQAETCQMKIK
jgi:hypothetical protein